MAVRVGPGFASAVQEEKVMSEENEKITEGQPRTDMPSLPSKPPGLVKEFFIFLRDYKLWWITPIVLVLLLLSLFIFFTEGSAVLPFIYAVF
jgi:hypothetical protein